MFWLDYNSLCICNQMHKGHAIMFLSYHPMSPSHHQCITPVLPEHAAMCNPNHCSANQLKSLFTQFIKSIHGLLQPWNKLSLSLFLIQVLGQIGLGLCRSHPHMMLHGFQSLHLHLLPNEFQVSIQWWLGIHEGRVLMVNNN